MFWSAVLALAMTLIGFLHDEPTDLTDAAQGGIVWGRVMLLFFGWFVLSELVMLIGGLLYIGSTRLRRGPRR